MATIRPVSDALQQKAINELFEVPERIPEDIRILREWVEKQPHIKGRTDDQFLLSFLRTCKFSIERAKEKYDMYYTVRTAMPEIFKNRDPLDKKSLEIIRSGSGLPLPLTETEDGARLFLIRPAVNDPELYPMKDIMKVNTMMMEVLHMEDDNFIIAGQVGILDLSDVTMKHFLQFDPVFIKKMTVLSQDASPFRQKGFHYVNTPSSFEYVFNMFKSFMSEKNKKRLYVHGNNMESLYQAVPRRLLPKEYGGEAGPIKDIVDYWEKKLIEHRDRFVNGDQYGTIEALRPGKPKTADSLFGVEGTFRKLNVD